MNIDTTKIKFLFPYIGTLLIICGYLKLHLYYSSFNIQISNYVEINEVLTLFLADALKYILLIFIVGLFFFLAESNPEIEKKENRKKDIIETEEWFLRFKKFIQFTSFILIILSIFLIFTIIAYIWNPLALNAFIVADTTIAIMFIFLYILFEFKSRYFRKYGKPFHGTYNNLILLVVMFFINVFQSAYIEMKTMRNENPYSVCFEYLSLDVQSSKTNIFLGQTKNYLLMYDLNNNEAQIFDRKDIKNLIIHKN